MRQVTLLSGPLEPIYTAQFVGKTSLYILVVTKLV
jgi:hypothetical protein